ncbi:MAG: class I adenylate-forming enzyme family protein [Amphiplicatus sp.]
MSTKDPAPTPRAWPAASLADIEARLCAPGALFEMETVEIRGVPTRSWKNQPRSLPALARRARDRFGANTFLVLGDERVSYEGWFRAAAALAADMRRSGVGRGDRVALAMPNLPEWPVVFFAAASLGAIIVPLNAWWTGAELQYGLSHSGAVLLVCDEERLKRIGPHRAELPDLREILATRAPGCGASARALERVIGAPDAYEALPDQDLPKVDIAPDDDATIFYTSGTSGAPKGALGTHRNMLTSTLSGAYSMHRAMLRRGEEPGPLQPKKTLMVIPFFHVTASHMVMMSTVMTGGMIVLMRKWDPIEAMRLIEREQITNAGGVPTIAWGLIEHHEQARFDLSSLEVVTYGGAPSAPELPRRIKSDLGKAPGNGWGMTETSAAVTMHNSEDYLNRPESCGPALPVSNIKIMSEDGREETPAGDVGELWAAGPQIVKGYWRNPSATAETFVDGWVRTGDLARIDEEGFCYIVDRAKDVIIRGGENIYSSEVENALYAHPAVIDAGVVGVPHRTLGEEPAAVVHLKPGARTSEAELRQWVRDRLAYFKAPVRIAFSDETLPRNANGKLIKKELRRLLEEHATLSSPS